MIVVRLVLLFELTLAAKCDHIVLDRKVEVLTLHARQFCFEHDLLLIFIDVDTGTPGSASHAFIVKAARHAAGKKAVHLFLKRAQVAERIITNDTHDSILQNSL